MSFYMGGTYNCDSVHQEVQVFDVTFEHHHSLKDGEPEEEESGVFSKGEICMQCHDFNILLAYLFVKDFQGLTN